MLKPELRSDACGVKTDSPTGDVGATSTSATDLWLIVGDDQDVVAARSAGLTAVAVPDLHAVLRHREKAIDAGLLTQVAGRSVTLVAKSDSDGRVRPLMAAATILREVVGAGGTAKLTYVPTISKVDTLHDLYVYYQSDRRRFRYALKKARRPADTDPLIDWIGRRWPWWSPQRRERELRRVVFYLTFLDGAANAWKPRLASALGLPGDKIEDLRSEAFTSAGGEELAEFNAEGWMTATDYRITPRGVFKIRTTKKKTRDEQIATAPININEMGTDEFGRRYCGLRFRHGREEQQVIVPRSTVTSVELLTLAERGAPVSTENLRQIVRFLQHQESENYDLLPRTDVFTRLGWTDDFKTFVLGRHVLGAPGRSVVQADGRFLDGLRADGSEGDYRQIAIEARDKSIAAELAWSTGYAPPLLRMLALRGLTVSVWGGSGSGKSASQALAMSPWGRPESLRLTGDVTPTALEAYLATSRDLIVHLDDTQQTRQRDLLDLLTYQSAGGVGRARGTQTGGLRPPATWLSLTFVSGEKPLLKEGVASGYANRLLELHAEPFEKPYAMTLHQALDDHHGHTGPQYIEKLIARHGSRAGRAALREMFDRETEHLDRGRSERAKQVALLVVADFLARVLVFEEDCETARAAARKMGVEIFGEATLQATATPDVVAAAHDEIVSYVYENIDNFTVDELNEKLSEEKKKVLRRLGAFVLAGDGTPCVAILPGPFRELAAKCHFDREQVLHGLHERGLLIKDEKDRLGKRTSELGSDRPRAFWIVLPKSDPIWAPVQAKTGTRCSSCGAGNLPVAYRRQETGDLACASCAGLSSTPGRPLTEGERSRAN